MTTNIFLFSVFVPLPKTMNSFLFVFLCQFFYRFISCYRSLRAPKSNEHLFICLFYQFILTFPKRQLFLHQYSYKKWLIHTIRCHQAFFLPCIPKPSLTSKNSVITGTYSMWVVGLDRVKVILTVPKSTKMHCQKTTQQNDMKKNYYQFAACWCSCTRADSWTQGLGFDIRME